MKNLLIVFFISIAAIGYAQDIEQIIIDGQEQAKKLEFDKALSTFTQAIKQFPQESPAYYERALIKLLQVSIHKGLSVQFLFKI